MVCSPHVTMMTTIMAMMTMSMTMEMTTMTMLMPAPGGPQVVCSPHVGAATGETAREVAREVAKTNEPSANRGGLRRRRLLVVSL